MGRITLGFRLCLFSLCVFVLAVIKADSNEKPTSPNPNLNPNPNVAEDSELPVSVVLERLEALEKRLKSSQENWDEQFQSLKKELDNMKNGNSGGSSGFRGSQSMLIRPAAPVSMATTTANEIGWEIERPGENWIVAKEMSRWDPDGRWGNAQLCPPATFVTGHKFTYFSLSGLTGIELTCTNKYETDERDNGHFLRVKSADEPGIIGIGEEWDMQNRGSRTNFAQGFSLNWRVIERRGSAPEIRKISKNYDIIYHGQNPEASALNSSGIVTKCPENHAICGLIPMMDAAGLGILSAVGFKCCSICTPEEKWETVYQFNNTKSTNEEFTLNTTVGLQQRPQLLKSNSTLNSTNLNFENAVDSVGISPSGFYQEFSAHLGNSTFSGFDWTAPAVSMGTKETNLTVKYTCKGKSSCVYQQLVGQCGNTRIPVDKVCQGSAPIELGVPESCTDASLTSCSVAMEILPSPRSKNKTIYPHGNSRGVEVHCDFETDGGGWTIIQKRTSGPKEEFKQNWNEYKNGFGSPDGNFWLGLENIWALTKNGDQELRIELKDFEGEKKYAKYSRFSISDASNFYRLTISGFSRDSTLQDDMAYHSGYKFSTIDKDNDVWHGHCAKYYGGGWWFNSCGWSNLNGLYFEKGETGDLWKGIQWYSWKGSKSSLAKSEMKIRKRKP